jgi:hypothetical protein
MPYDYRRMTPEEREEVVAHRHELGYSLHQPPHPFRDAGHYFITAANYEHASIMSDGMTGKRQVWYRYSDEWPWSSLLGYLETEGRERLREWWKLHPLGDFGRGWDD